MMVEKHWIRSEDGTGLSARETGNPRGKAIILIHGYCASQYVFDKQIHSEELQQFRLISFDLRGHGESDKPSDPLMYTEGKRWASDVKAVIDQLKVDRPVLLGWSLGGRVISQYLAVHGDRSIAGINFVSSRNFIDPARDVLGPASHFFRTMDTPDLLENIERTTKFIEHCYAQPLSERDMQFMIAINMVVPWNVRAAVLRWPAEFADALKKTNLPCLVTHGKKDEVILPDAAEVTVGMMRQARISWYENSGHVPCWEEVLRFNRELASFRQSVN